MLHVWLKVKKYLPLVSQKFTNGYLVICSDGFNFLRLWQMMPKMYWVIFFCMFIVNVIWTCQTKKIVMYGVSQIYEWILRDTYRWVKVSKPIQKWWLKLLSTLFSQIIVKVTCMTQSQKIFTFGVSNIYKWLFRHMFRWIQLSKAVTNDA